MTRTPTPANTCACGRQPFRRGLCVTCYRHARHDGTIPLTHQRRRADVVEDVTWLLKTGETHPETVAHRAGYRTTDSLYAALRRAGRRDLIERLQKRA